MSVSRSYHPLQISLSSFAGGSPLRSALHQHSAAGTCVYRDGSSPGVPHALAAVPVVRSHNPLHGPITIIPVSS